MLEQAIRPAFVLDEAAIHALETELTGTLVRPTDTAYDTARQIWNARFNRRPALVVRPAGPEDVVRAVRFAKEQELPLAVRGGGHSLAGLGVVDDGLVLDMSGMRKITVDPAARVARVEAGARWKDLEAATGPHGLATPAGTCPTTGVAGVALGGGVGWLTRHYGLSIDNLLAVDIVTADGVLRHASATENVDLFWAVRGGGGNFGVVTALEMRLYPVTMLFGGMIGYPVAQAGEVLRFYREFAATAPDAFGSIVMFMTAPPLPFVPPALHGQPVIVISVAYSGDLEEGARVLAPLRAFGAPAVDTVGPVPYAVMQAIGEPAGELGVQHYIKSGYLDTLSDAAIDTIVAYAAAMPGPMTALHLNQLGGAMRRVPAGATAFGRRTAQFIVNAMPTWVDPAQAATHRAWADNFLAAMAPVLGEGVYVNFLDTESPERVRAAYGANWDRLRAVKRRYDPTNFFRQNQNIPPADEC
jgi:FAD/FMN-containing dehydrogenase